VLGIAAIYVPDRDIRVGSKEEILRQFPHRAYPESARARASSVVHLAGYEKFAEICQHLLTLFGFAV
jgi:hypothetical protein